MKITPSPLVRNYQKDPEWKHFFGSITRGFVLEEIFLNKAGEPVDYRILAMNKTGERMWGLDAGDSIGKTGHQIRSKSQKFLLHTLASVIKTGKAIHFEFFSERMDRFFDLEVFTPAKGIVAILISDITDQRNTEEALRESEDKFKYIFDYSVVGKSITLPSGEIQVNKAFSNLLGYSQEELQNKRWQDITHPDDIDLTQKEIDALLTGNKKATRFIKRFLSKEVSVVWADIATSLRRSKDGKPLYFMTTIVDITEQKRAEEENYRLSQRYSNLLSSVPEIIMEVNNKKVYTWANPAGYDFFGDDVIGKTAAHYFEGKQETYDIVAPLFNGDQNTFYVESWQRRKDGQKRLLAWWCRSLKDEKGNVLGALSSAQDITERKQADEVLRTSEERYHSLFENMLNGFAYCQMLYDGKRPVDFIYLDVNNAFESLTGLKNAAGKKVSELIPGIRESDPELFKIYGHVALTGKPEVFEIYVEALNMWFSVSVYSPQKKYFVAVFDVITQRKRAEEALHESEEKFRSLFESMSEMAVLHEIIYDKNGKAIDYKIIDCNPAFPRIIGITREKAIGGLASDIFGTGEAPFLSIYADVARTGHSQYFETYLPQINKHLAVSAFSPSAGRFGTLTSDITERKQAEQALHDREQELSNIYSSVQDVIFQLGVEEGGKYRFLSVNDAFNRVTGLDPHQIVGKLVNEVIPEPSLTMVLKNYRQAIKENKTVGWEETTDYPTGRLIGEVSVTPILNADGKCNRLVGVVHDITARKRSEEALRLSEGNFRTLFEQAGVGVALLETKTGRFVRINQKYCDFLGYTIEELLNKKFQDVTHPDDIQTNIDNNALLIDGTIKDFSIEKRYIRKDGTIVWGKLTASPLWKPGTKPDTHFHIAVVEDITERKKAEESLQRSQQETAHANRLLLALSQATQAAQRARTPEVIYTAIQEKMIQLGYKATVFELTPEGKGLRLAYTNYDSSLMHKAEKMTGLSMRDYLFHPRQGSSMQCALTQGKTVHVADATLAVADAMPRAIRAFARPVADMLHLEPSTFAPLNVDNETLGVLVVTGQSLTEADNPAVAAFANQTAIAIQNARLYQQAQHEITERTQAEEGLRKSEAQWRSLVTTIPDYVAMLGVDGSYLFLNHYAEGFSEKDIRGEKAPDFIMQESRQSFISQLEKCVKTRQTQRMEYKGYGDERSTRVYEGFLAPIIENGKVVNILSLAKDITERKAMEEALRKSEESFRNLFENSTVGLYRTTPDGKILLANATLVNLLGYESFEELAMRNLEKDGFEPGYQRQEFKKLVEAGTLVQGLEITWKRKDGSDIFVRESAKAIRDTSGKVQYYEGTVEDITGRKKAEEELRENERKYRLLVDNSPDNITRFDPVGRILLVNRPVREGLEMLLDIKEEDFIGKTYRELGFPEEQCKYWEESQHKVVATGLPLTTEYIFEVLGDTHLFEWRLIPEPNQEGKIGTILAMSRDITERKKAEEALQRSSEELRARNEDLERFNKAAVGRELRMIELKKKINELCLQLDQPAPYPNLGSNSIHSKKD